MGRLQGSQGGFLGWLPFDEPLCFVSRADYHPMNPRVESECVYDWEQEGSTWGRAKGEKLLRWPESGGRGGIEACYPAGWILPLTKPHSCLAAPT